MSHLDIANSPEIKALAFAKMNRKRNDWRKQLQFKHPPSIHSWRHNKATLFWGGCHCVWRRERRDSRVWLSMKLKNCGGLNIFIAGQTKYCYTSRPDVNNHKCRTTFHIIGWAALGANSCSWIPEQKGFDTGCLLGNNGKGSSFIFGLPFKGNLSYFQGTVLGAECSIQLP